MNKFLAVFLGLFLGLMFSGISFGAPYVKNIQESKVMFATSTGGTVFMPHTKLCVQPTGYGDLIMTIKPVEYCAEKKFDQALRQVTCLRKVKNRLHTLRMTSKTVCASVYDDRGKCARMATYTKDNSKTMTYINYGDGESEMIAGTLPTCDVFQ